MITRGEMQRIQASVQPTQHTCAESNRKALTSLSSDDRVQHWPNTLEASRKNKESFKQDRAAAVRGQGGPPTHRCSGDTREKQSLATRAAEPRHLLLATTAS